MAAHSEYECGECRHRFRAPEDAPHDTRSLMCPACGSIDLNRTDVVRPRPVVLRAPAGAPAGDWRSPHQTKVS
jgi:DNA-directed RNA polymerase subunit RPC12/RpoP